MTSLENPCWVGCQTYIYSMPLWAQDLLIASSTPSTLEWNEGNHFQDNGLRTAKGFAWVINRIQTP